ncbi:zinc finger protein 624-like [Ornithodoros turicata]|uniref:zinc finger protein 624-like n=1 Tax=Ornithodoros turicata TaxID=34597 RepID=UPI003139DD3F
MRPLTEEERAQVVLWYNTYGSLRRVRTEFRKTYDRRPPSTHTILHWAKRFTSDGTVNNARRLRNRSTNELEYAVIGAFEVNPKMGVRQAARLFSVDPSVIRRALGRNCSRSRGEEKSAENAQLVSAAVYSQGAPTGTPAIGELVRQLKIMPPRSRDGKRLLYCSHCLYATQFPSCMKAHQRRHEKDCKAEEGCPAEALKCRHCRREFADRKTYIMHLHEHKHEKAERERRQWELAEKKRLEIERGLKKLLKRKETQQVIHVRRPTVGKQSDAELFCIPLNDLPFSCGDCHASFRDKASLAGHEQSHGEAKPFECDLCPASFVHLKKLRCHERAQHRMLPCSARRERLGGEEEHARAGEKEHARRGVAALRKKKLFGCYMCRATFPKRSAFLYHMSQHVVSYVAESGVVGPSTITAVEGIMKESLGKPDEKPAGVGNEHVKRDADDRPSQVVAEVTAVEPPRRVVQTTAMGPVVEITEEPSVGSAMESVSVVKEECLEPDEGTTELFIAEILKDHAYARVRSGLETHPSAVSVKNADTVRKYTEA